MTEKKTCITAFLPSWHWRRLKEKINLLRAQIAALKECLNECINKTMKQKYGRGLAELGNKLDELLLSQFSY
jgi:hypothetical protein